MMEELCGSVMDIFKTCGENFTAVERTIGNSTEFQSEENPLLRVIWAEEIDGNTVEIICELTVPGDEVVTAYMVKVVDSKGDVVAKSYFVSFNRNTAVASAKISKKIFSKCSVLMETAKIGAEVRLTSYRESLEQFDTGVIHPHYNVTAPVKSPTRSSIRISYYKWSSESDYDYVYPEAGYNQFICPPPGTLQFRIQNCAKQGWIWKFTCQAERGY